MKYPFTIPPYVARFLLGVGVVVLVFVVYRSDAQMVAMRAGLSRDIARVLGEVFPPQHATRMLDVPFHRQEHALSCEIASLRSALLAVGIDIPEATLLTQLAYDNTPKKTDAAGNITWGDPNKGFVGDINGRMPRTGYGVHAPPIKQVAEKYAVVNDIKANDAEAIATAIGRGHPVIVWSVLGKKPSVLNWKTPSGDPVSAALYEHTLVVAGYKGSPAAIESVMVVDPLTGLREEPWDEFVWRTGFLGHQALEIVPVRFGS